MLAISQEIVKDINQNDEPEIHSINDLDENNKEKEEEHQVDDLSMKP